MLNNKLALMSLLLCNILIGQVDFNNQRHKIGIKGSIEKSMGGIKPINVFNYGVQYLYSFSQRSSIETGVYKITRTDGMFFISKTYLNEDTIVNYRLENISIPFKYRFDKRFLLWGCYGTIGLYTEYLFNRSVVQPKNTINIGYPNNKKYMAGIIIGGGINKKLTNIFTVFTEFVYSNNLTSIYKNEGVLSGSSLSTPNYGFTVGINYTL